MTAPDNDAVSANFDLDEARALLARTPRVLRAMLAGLPDVWLSSTEGPETWSPIQVVAHLVDLEETDWPVRARIILEQGPNRRFQPVDRFRHLRESEGKSLDDLLDRFEALRGKNLHVLFDSGIFADELLLKAEHPALGTVTLQQLLATWVVHDLTHIYQIVRTMAGRYREDVGPWIEYLSVLNR